MFLEDVVMASICSFSGGFGFESVPAILDNSCISDGLGKTVWIGVAAQHPLSEGSSVFSKKRWAGSRRPREVVGLDHGDRVRVRAGAVCSVQVPRRTNFHSLMLRDRGGAMFHDLPTTWRTSKKQEETPAKFQERPSIGWQQKNRLADEVYRLGNLLAAIFHG